MSCHCPRHGEVLAPAIMTHCPLCGLPLLTNANGGHGLRWIDDANRKPDIADDRERQAREAREQHT